MAKGAVIELTAHIESIRQEAYDEGYAAAMRTVAEFSTSKATVAKAAPAMRIAAATTRTRHAGVKPATRQRRGDNMRHITEAMMTLPHHTGPAAAIKKALVGKGHDISYTSIRHGLGQLQARGEASLAADGRTWSYTAP